MNKIFEYVHFTNYFIIAIASICIYFVILLKYSFPFMLIFVDNISHCEEKCIYNVSTIPMTARIKVATIRK